MNNSNSSVCAPFSGRWAPSQAQGTIEYLLIIAVVVVISLVVVGLIINQMSSANNVSTSVGDIKLKSSLIGVVDSAVGEDGNALLRILNNVGENIFVKKVIVDEIDHNYGVGESLVLGDAKTFVLNNLPVCESNEEKKSFSVKIIYNSSNGLEKTMDYGLVSIDCVEAINPVGNYIGESNSVESEVVVSDSIPPTITLYLPLDNNTITSSDTNISFVFSSDQDTNACYLYIDDLLVDQNLSLVYSDNNYFLDANIANFGGGDHTWDVNCTDTNGLLGTAIDQNINYYSPSQIELLRNGLVGYWPFDNLTGATAIDYSGQGNDGTLVNGTIINQTGKVGRSFYFDGTNDYVSIANATSMNYGTNFTIGLWIKHNISGVWMWLFTKPTKSWLGLYPTNGNLTWTKAPAVDYVSSQILSTNTWYYGVLTYANGDLNLYVDGTKVGGWTGINLEVTSGTTYIGQRGDDYQYFMGYLDEVALWNRTLSEAEILELYNSGAGLSLNFDTNPPELTLFSPQDNITIDSVDSNISFVFSSDQDTNACYFYFDNIQIDSNLDFVLQDTNYFFDLNIADFGYGDHNWVVSCMDSNGVTANSLDQNIHYNYPSVAALLSVGLVGYWPFDETSGTTATDYAGFDDNGTISEALVNQIGKVGNSFYFDGTNDYVNVGNSSRLNYGSTFTIGVWLKSSTTGWRWIFSKPSGSWLGISSGGYFNWSRIPGQDYTSSKYVVDNNWYYGVMTFDNGTLKLYIDGVEVRSATGVTLAYTSGTTYIGQRADNYQYFQGYLDEVALWNRVLSTSEISSLYNSGDGLSLIP